MAMKGRAFGKADDQASCEVARSVSRRIGLPDSVSDSLYDIHEWWNGAGARSLRGEQIARPARIARVATETSELLSLGARDVVAALRHRARKTLDPAMIGHFASVSAAIITETTSGDPRRPSCRWRSTPTIAQASSCLIPSGIVPRTPRGGIFRSDHVPYARLNVPALFFSTNLHNDYHTARDNPDRIDYAKLTRMTRWVYLTGWIVANVREHPAIDAGFQLER